MGFYNCVVDALKKGRITERMYKGLEDHLMQHGLDFTDKSDLTTPEAQRILEEAIRNVDEVTALKKKQLALAVVARERNEAFIKERGGARPVQALVDTLQEVTNRESVIKQQWAARMDGFFQRFAKGNFLGNFLRKETDRDKFGMEMMRPGSSKSADHAALAKEVQQQMIESVKRRADAGMDIKIKKNYGLQTRHDGIAISKAGYDEWVKNVMQNVKYINEKPIGTVKDLPAVLREVFDQIKGEHAGLGNGDPLNHSRVFSFGDDYAAWKAYNKPFGMSAGDPVEAVRLNLNQAAGEAALLEQFGPHPKSMVDHLKKYAMEQANELNKTNRGPASGTWASRKARMDMAQFDGMYRAMTEPDSPLSGVAAFYQGSRALIYSRIAEVAYLSQLPIDLLSRLPTLKMINKLPMASMVKQFTRYVPGLVSDEARQIAIRAGAGGDHLFNELHKGNDAVLREHPIMGRVMSVNDPVARAFFVHAHMETLPRNMALDFMANFAKWKDLEFGKLPIAESMRRAGVTPSDWDAFRKTEIADNGGMKLLQPVDMLKREDMPKQQLREIATRIGMYINGEARETVPAPNLRNRYALAGNFDKNSVAGMIVQDMTVALQFTGSTAMMLARGFMLRNGVASKAAYAAAVGTALLGANALRMQAKALAAGRDPYDMNPANKAGRDFWAENLLSSGFAGPSLDLLNPNRAGSVSSTIGKAVMAGYHGIQYQLGDTQKDPHTALTLFDQARHFIPGADGWYSQLVATNWALDNIAREVDNEAYQKQQRLTNYYRTTWGQDTWFGHGADAVRAPDLSKAFQGMH